jgi:hypothetical protein
MTLEDETGNTNVITDFRLIIEHAIKVVESGALNVSFEI